MLINKFQHDKGEVGMENSVRTRPGRFVHPSNVRWKKCFHPVRRVSSCSSHELPSTRGIHEGFVINVWCNGTMQGIQNSGWKSRNIYLFAHSLLEPLHDLSGSWHKVYIYIKTATHQFICRHLHPILVASARLVILRRHTHGLQLCISQDIRVRLGSQVRAIDCRIVSVCLDYLGDTHSARQPDALHRYLSSCGPAALRPPLSSPFRSLLYSSGACCRPLHLS